MQTLRPLLRSYQAFGAGPNVGGSSKYLGRTQPAIRILGSQHRTQHDNYGPHKEYFQIPGKEPKPDLTPYVRASQEQRTSQAQTNTQSRPATPTYDRAIAEQQTAPKARGWRRIPSFIRGAVWFLVFVQLGVVAGTALITWEYLSPPFEPGSPEEQELVEEILETLETHPLVADLRENQWIEIEPFTPDLKHGLKGRNMVHQTLGGNNTQGIFMKVFHHPQHEFTMLVFLLGFGVEGWPDIVHGGIISTLLQEGLSKHLAYFYPGYPTTPDNRTNIDFKKPCKPGEIYGVLVAPSGRKVVTVGNVPLTELQMTSLLVQLAGAPVVATEFDIGSNTETHTVGIPTSRGQQPTHAICQAEIKIVPKDLNGDGQGLQIGEKDDGGFGRALDILKKMPEFKNTQLPPPPTQSANEDEQDKN